MAANGDRDPDADREALDRMMTLLLLSRPFYAHVAMHVMRTFSAAVPTLGVRYAEGRPLLTINPAFFFDELPGDPFRVGALEHEILHLIFRHPLFDDDRDPESWNIACDLYVNQFLRPEELPPGSLIIDDYEETGIRRGMSSELIYEMLLESRGEEGAPPPSPAGTGGHEGWSRKGESERKTARALTERALFDAWQRAEAKEIEDLPEELRQLMPRIEKARKADLDWREALSLFASSSASSRLSHSFMRISRRYGTSPGLRLKRRRRLLVAVDTSGSISPLQLRIFFDEIDAVRSSGASLAIVECDDEVRRSYEYEGGPPDGAAGGGNTAFEPVMRWLNEEAYADFDGLVYLTDGIGPPPETKPYCPVLWVLSEDARDDAPGPRFGPVVKIRS